MVTSSMVAIMSRIPRCETPSSSGTPTAGMNTPSSSIVSSTRSPPAVQVTMTIRLRACCMALADASDAAMSRSSATSVKESAVAQSSMNLRISPRCSGRAGKVRLASIPLTLRVLGLANDHPVLWQPKQIDDPPNHRGGRQEREGSSFRRDCFEGFEEDPDAAAVHEGELRKVQGERAPLALGQYGLGREPCGAQIELSDEPHGGGIALRIKDLERHGPLSQLILLFPGLDPNHQDCNVVLQS